MEERIKYTIIRSRRKTVSIEVKDSSTVIVRAPLKVGKEYIDKFVSSKADQIRSFMEKLKRLEDSAEPKLTENEMNNLKKAALEYFPEAVKYYSGLMGVAPEKISIRFQKTRWGSCSSRKTITFNALLMLFPHEIADSVVVHEMAHLKHLNHSKAFYNEVLKYCPDYYARKDYLKKHGKEAMLRLPDR